MLAAFLAVALAATTAPVAQSTPPPTIVRTDHYPATANTPRIEGRVKVKCPDLAKMCASSRPVVWAWERTEDLRFLPPDTEIAVQSGFVELSGSEVRARGRRFALKASIGQVTTALVHVQIDHRKPLLWTPELRAATAREILRLAGVPGIDTVQIDFEVRASERGILLDLLRDVRAALPVKTKLAMTALASWCDGESWLNDAPVDEIAPMLFRMGSEGEIIKARLAGGGDFQPNCRAALAVSADAPVLRAPSGRRVYLFSPRSWTAAEFALVRERVEAWGDR